MKHIITKIMAFPVALLLVGCSADEDAADDSPILFGSAARSQPTTRADKDYFIDGTTTKTIPEGAQVGLFGYYQGNTSWADMPTKTANLFYNEPLTASRVSDTQVNLGYATPTRYWPNTAGDLCSFIAYYPYSAMGSGEHGISISTENIGTGSTLGKIPFVMNDDPSKQVDFLVSEMRGDMTKPAANQKVELRFKHVLTRLEIDLNNRVSQDDLKTISIAGVRKSDNCVLGYADGVSAYEWENYDNTTGQDGTLTMTKAQFQYEPSFLMIPQKIDSKVVVTKNDNSSEEYDIKVDFQGGRSYKYLLGGGVSEGSETEDIVGTIWYKNDEGFADNDLWLDASDAVAGNPFGVTITPGVTKMCIYYITPDRSSGSFSMQIQNGKWEPIGTITQTDGGGTLGEGPMHTSKTNWDPVKFVITSDMLDKFNDLGGDNHCFHINKYNATIYAITFQD